MSFKRLNSLFELLVELDDGGECVRGRVRAVAVGGRAALRHQPRRIVLDGEPAAGFLGRADGVEAAQAAAAAELAARAARRVSPTEISDMHDILEQQDKKLRAGESAIAEDSEFHYTIAMASGNSVVLKVLDILMDLLRDTRERTLQVEGRPQKSLTGHRLILSAIKRHDPEGAKAAMRRHIEDVEEMVLHKL